MAASEVKSRLGAILDPMKEIRHTASHKGNDGRPTCQTALGEPQGAQLPRKTIRGGGSPIVPPPPGSLLVGAKQAKFKGVGQDIPHLPPPHPRSPRLPTGTSRHRNQTDRHEQTSPGGPWENIKVQRAMWWVPFNST